MTNTIRHPLVGPTYISTSSCQPRHGCRTAVSSFRRHRFNIGDFRFSIRTDSYASLVTSSKHQLSRLLIFGGFVLLALSTAISSYNYLSQDIPSGTGFSIYAQLILEALSALFAAAGWWFLSQLEAKSSVQESLLAKAYALLGLQFSASCVAHLVGAGGVIFIDRFSAPFWITALGFGVGAGGFFLTSFTMRSIDLMPPNS